MQIEKRYVAEERNASGKLRGVAYYSSVDEFEREMNAIADCWTPEAGTTVTLYDTWEWYHASRCPHDNLLLTRLMMARRSRAETAAQAVTGDQSRTTSTTTGQQAGKDETT